MNISGLKRYFSFLSIYLFFFIFISVFSSIAQAASSDIQAQLSDNSGSTGFSVLNNSGNQVTRADSTGNLTTAGIMAAAGNVGAGTTTPRYALDVNGDIGNSVSGMLVLEGSVDTTYNVLDDSNGNAYFTGNVGIGSTVPSGTSLEVNGIIHSASGGFTFPDGTTQTSAASGGNAWSMGSGNVYTTTRTNNVGIGTSSPSALLAVGLNAFTVNTSGAITATTGITNSGAYIQNGGGAANTFTGNVGIGSTVPGTTLDVNGTVRMTGLTMSGGTPSSGYVLTAADSNGDTMWSPSGSVGTNYWSLTGGAGNVGISTTNTVGIGTTSAGAGAGLVVMNGNVGIGTWVPSNAALELNGSISMDSSNPTITSHYGGGANGELTINMLSTTIGWGGQDTLYVGQSNNVGIGSTNPGQRLDVNGTARMVGLTVSGGVPSSGYVLTAADSSGDTMWSPSGSVGTNYWSLTAGAGNVGISTTNTVGIGTTSAGAGAGLVVMNGNVGIGTWAPQYDLQVKGNSFFNGNAAVGSTSGNAGGSGTITSSGTGSFAAGDVSGTGSPGTMTSSNTGSIALGYVDAAGTAASMTSSNTGSIAAGFSLGTLTSSGTGSIAMGEASPSHTLQATQSGSVAIGQDVQATASNALAFGESVVNNTSNTFMVGFNAAPTLTVTATNVGIGSINPGQALDVQGTVRMTGFTMGTGVPSSGYVLTAADSSGDAVWSPSGSVGTNYWSLTGGAGNVGISTTNTVGIGTTAGVGAGLVVMNGNVGIGTWVPSAPLAVNGDINLSGSSGGTIAASVAGENINIQTAANTGGNAGNIVLTGGGGTVSTGGAITAQGGQGSIGGAITIVSGGGSTTGGNVSITAAGSGTSGSVTISSGSGGSGGTIGITGGGTAGSGIVTINGGLSAPVILSSGSGQNVGIGTITTKNKLDLAGNASIGSSYAGFQAAPANGLLVQGNVGIGSAAPGQTLDVNGTARMVGLTVSGGVPSSGYVLTAADSSGDTMWSPSGSVGTNYWSLTAGAGNVGISTTNTVGIGTTSAGAGAGLVVMNGNVGIGTWIPTASLAVGTNAFTVNSTGAITATTGITTSGAYTQSGTGVNYFTGNVGVGTTAPQTRFAVVGGNVGIGTWTAAGGNLIVNGGGNVGIGSAWPGTALDVQGSVRATGFIAGTGGITLNGVTNTSWPSAGSNYWSLTAAAGNVGISTTNTVGIGTTSAGAGAGLVVMNGNVGIGTWAPQASVDSAGTIRVTGSTTPSSGVGLEMQYLTGAGGYGQFLTYDRTNFVYHAFAFDALNEQFYNSGTEAMRITSGNLGIGTNTPSSRLTVLGNIGIGRTAGDTYLTTAAPNGGMIVEGDVGIGSINPGQALDVQGTVRATNFVGNGSGLTGVGSNWTYTSSGNIGLSTTAAVGIGTTFIGGAGEGALTVMNGNVGIGTWAPNDALDVEINNSTKAAAQFINNSATYGSVIAIGQSSTKAVDTGYYGSGETTFNSLIANTGYLATGTGAVQLSIVTTGAQPITFDTDNFIERVRIQPTTGNVGIGSTVPGQTLDVQGTVRATEFIAGTGGITLGGVNNTSWPSAGSNYWSLTAAAGNVGVSTTNTVGIGTTSAGAGAGLVVMNGNVGIGTWAPADLFQVGKFKSSSGGFEVDSNGNVGMGTTITSNASLSVMSGNVGIGTWVPATQLDVNGNIQLETAGSTASSPTTIGFGPDSTGNAQRFRIDTDDALQAVYGGRPAIYTYWGMEIHGQQEAALPAPTANGTSTDPSLSIFGTESDAAPILQLLNNAGTSKLFTVNGAGNVGIGTWVPTQQLDIKGTGTSELTIQNNWLSGAGVWINMSTDGPSAIGSGGAGTNPWVAYVPTAGDWFGGSAVGDIAYRNISGRLLFGTTSSAPGMVISTSNNVGIGSAAPGETLDVTGTVRATNFIGNGSGLTGITGASNWIYSSSGNIGLSTTAAVGIGTTFTTTSALTVMNGNVGIGTWVPGSSLQVVGSETVSGTNAQLYLQGTGSALLGFQNTSSLNSPAQMQFFKMGGGTGGQPGSGQGLGEVLFGAYTSGYALNQNLAEILVAIDGSVTDSSMPTYMSFSTAPSGTITAAERMRITNGGNIGIGSTVPGQLLDVQGTVRATNFIGNGSGLTGISSGLWNTTNTNDVYEENGSTYGNVGIGTTFTTTSALTVMNGNVGIGTWVTDGALSLSQNGSIAWPNGGTFFNVNTAFVSSNNYNFQYWNGSSQVSVLTIAGNLNGNIGIGTTTPAGALTVMSGNVGIGTWVPGSLLDVAGNFILGQAASSADSISTSGATDSFAGGNASHGGGAVSGSITSSGIGSLAFGYSQGSGGGNNTSIISNSDGSIAMGYALGGNIESENTGSIAMGYAGSGTLEATQPGAIAMGYTNGQNIEATGPGSIAMGYSLFTGSAIPVEATGTASVAIGENVQATANNAFALGTSVVNNTASTFMVGFNTAPTLTVTAANVGIGSISPGQALDVQGTVRATNFVGNGSGLTNLPSSGLWNTTNTNDVYEKNGSTFGNVGIGTTITNAGAALSVMNGNVGIGTWIPRYALSIGADQTNNSFIFDPTTGFFGSYNSSNSTYYGISDSCPGPTENGKSSSALCGYFKGMGIFGTTYNLGNPIFAIGTTLNTSGPMLAWDNDQVLVGTPGSGPQRPNAATYLTVTGGTSIGNDFYINNYGAPTNGLIVEGNVGIGSTVPGQALDVQGTVRATNFIGNGSGLTGISAGLWNTTNTNDVYEKNGSTFGNVGIGTTITNAGAALSVMNGNVGIGTWVPNAALDVINGSIGMSDNQAVSWRNGSSNALGRILLSSSIASAIHVGDVDGMGSRSLVLHSSANYPVVIDQGIVEAARFDGNGNLGIGTTTPVGGLVVMNGNVGIGTWIPSSTFNIKGSLAVQTTSTSASGYTALSTDQVILANASSNNVTITLPAVASVPGREYIIKKTDSSANSVTIQANGAETIDGQNTVSTTTQYQSYTIVSNGTAWYII